jgi:hypothetical protein
MTILPQLLTNKGTVSSALGKALANQVLDGESAILAEAAELLAHDSKDVRAGAAKIIEQVAMEEPSLVVPLRSSLLPALDVPELQTRWMVIHALGHCARLDVATALRALPKAEQFLAANSGACLWGATIRYLGFLGATSEANARRAFPILERALRDIPRQAKNVLDSFLRLWDQADEETRAEIVLCAERFVHSDRPGIGRAARTILKAQASIHRQLSCRTYVGRTDDRERDN